LKENWFENSEKIGQELIKNAIIYKGFTETYLRNYMIILITISQR